MDWRLALMYWLMSMFHEGRGCSLHSRTTITDARRAAKINQQVLQLTCVSIALYFEL